MRSRRFLVAAAGAVALLVAGLHVARPDGDGPMPTAGEVPMVKTEDLPKTDAEWKRKLSPEQYRILRQAGTERPFGEVYAQFKKQGVGTYYCAGCGQELFSFVQKFDSHCGWPSFWDPSKSENVRLRRDVSHGMTRTEVVCAKCEGHLGHLFEGEGFDTPTDRRYCINGLALVFVPGEGPKEEPREPPSGK